MALSVALRHFTWLDTDAVNTTYDINFGFTPKMMILFNGGITTSTTDTISSTGRSRSAIGFAVSSSNRRALTYESLDGASAANLASIQRNSGCLVGAGSAGILDLDSELNWPANSARFIVDSQPTNAMRVSVLALGGDDITNQTTGQFQEPASSGSQSITSVGFQPTGVIFANIGFETVNSSRGTGGMFSIGVSDGTRQWVIYLGGDDGADPMDNVSYGRSGEVIAMGPEPAVTLNALASLTQFTANGFDLDWSQQTATGRFVFFLAWAGGNFRVDNTATRTDTTQFSQTGFGFAPLASLFGSVNRAESSSGTPTANAQISLGMAESPTTRVAHSNWDQDNVATSECAQAIEYDEVYINIDSTEAVVGLMDLVSFDAGGQTLVMDDADPSAAFVGTASWGATAATSPPTPDMNDGVTIAEDITPRVMMMPRAFN